MKDEEIEDAEPGPELDAAIAAEVMGFTIFKTNITVCWTRPDGGASFPFTPSRDMTQAWQVIHRMKEELFYRQHEFLIELQRQVSKGVLPRGSYVAWPNAALYITPVAICRAALRIIRTKKLQQAIPHRSAP